MLLESRLCEEVWDAMSREIIMIAADTACHRKRKMFLHLMHGSEPVGNVICPSVSLWLCWKAFLNALRGCYICLPALQNPIRNLLFTPWKLFGLSKRPRNRGRSVLLQFFNICRNCQCYISYLSLLQWAFLIMDRDVL